MEMTRMQGTHLLPVQKLPCTQCATITLLFKGRGEKIMPKYILEEEKYIPPPERAPGVEIL